MRVAVVIPWRGGQRDRERHRETVRAHLRGLLPDAIHMDVDSGHTPFSRAGSRNLGVRLAQEAECDVVLLNDADTLPEREPLLAAIEAAHREGVMALPYDRFLGLSKNGTRSYLRGVPAAACEVELETTWSTGGVMVVTPTAWERAGGMDERFQGWGWEDSCLRIAADALLGPTVKIPGVIVHLHHPTAIAPETDEYRVGAELAARYVEAEGNPEAVRAIVAEHNPSIQVGVT